MTDVIWTSDRIDELTRLRAEGLSCRQIAIEMGCFSHCFDQGRSAVSGKIHRLHLAPAKNKTMPKIKPARKKPGKVSSLSQTPRNPTRNIAAGAAIAAAEPGLPKILDEMPDGTGIKLIDLKGDAGAVGSSCRWPRGDPKKPDFEFCGRNAFAGFPYCARHCQRAFPPMQAR